MFLSSVSRLRRRYEGLWVAGSEVIYDYWIRRWAGSKLKLLLRYTITLAASTSLQKWQ